MNDYYLAAMVFTRQAMLKQLADDVQSMQASKARRSSRRSAVSPREGVVVQLRQRANSAVRRLAA